jgi:hypothetical protein
MSVTTLLCLAALAAGLVACGLYGRERVWEKGRLAEQGLGELGRVRLPAELRPDGYEARETGDWAAYGFRRVHDTHLNGQTSYAEALEVTVYAEDFPLGAGEGRWEWTVTAEVYERHPVTEPSWRVVLVDRERRVRLEWRGFQKQYRVETAKRNLLFVAEGLALGGDRAAFFAARRDWEPGTWATFYAENRRAVERELGMVLPVGEWREKEGWRYGIDNGRPQRLIAMRRLGADRREAPVDFRGPVTSYSVLPGHVWQDNQGSGGGLAPREMVEALRGDLGEVGTRTFFVVQTVNLWRAVGASELRSVWARALEMEREYAAGRLVVEAARR